MRNCWWSSRYIFGFEESYGYLSGSFVRDKDAVNASLLICEMFAYYKSQGRSLTDVLDELYQTCGYYESRLLSFAFEGSDGFTKMQALMDDLRNDPLKEIGGYPVERCIDYQAESVNGLPKSNVLRYLLEGGMEATVRPSGTEPKLKVYLTAVGKDRAESQAIASQMAGFFKRVVD